MRVLARAGATVIVPSRSAEKLHGLRDAAGAEGLHLLDADIGTPAGLAALAEAVDAYGRLDAVVGSIGSFWAGPGVVEVPSKTVREQIEARVAPHLSLVQTLGPRLRAGGAFVHLSGLVALFGLPGLSALGISTAAQLAVTRAFQAEAKGPRVFGLVIEQFVRTRSRQDLPEDALTADEVGEAVRNLIAGERAGAMLALRKVHGSVEVEPLPPPVSPKSVERLTAALGG